MLILDLTDVQKGNNYSFQILHTESKYKIMIPGYFLFCQFIKLRDNNCSLGS